MALKQLKLGVFQVARSLGLARGLRNSGWRRNRLLILGYHGISLEDEHCWRPALYMSAEVFRRRLEILREESCTVLPLEEALSRLEAGCLPPRSVAITVDDGSCDFHRVAAPLLKEYGYPALVYLTTYYSDFNRPVFDTMCSYMFWKSRREEIELPGILPEGRAALDARGRPAVERAVLVYAREKRLNGREKDNLLADLGVRLGVDYESLCRKRLLTLMDEAEVREVSAAGFDVQLHTHRHRAYRDRERWLREIDENKLRIERLTGRAAVHFCYPAGYYRSEYPAWLGEHGVRSAVTCKPGLAARGTDRYLLPRLMDSSSLSEQEFRAWATGLADWAPKRRFDMTDWPLWE